MSLEVKPHPGLRTPEQEIIFLAQLHLLIERYQQSIPWGRETLRNVAELALELSESEL